MNKIKLGTKYTDSVTGFSGVATAKIEYLTGCTQYELTPPVGTDGKLPDRQWFDESRLHEGAAPKGGPGPSSLPTFGR